MNRIDPDEFARRADAQHDAMVRLAHNLVPRMSAMMSYLGLVFTLYVLIGHASFSILNPEHEDAGSVASAIGLAAFVGCCFLASLFVIAGWEAIIYLQMSRRLG